MKKKIPYLLMGVFLLIGLGIFAYPTISAWYNAQFQIRAVVSYDDSIAQMSAQLIEQELQRAEQYNRKLTGSGIEDPFVYEENQALFEEYNSILNVNNGIMGAIQIPKIDVNLPIYHGISNKVLEKGVGHLEMTAFPIGGEGNHAVLTGHTALPSAVLFIDLDKLVLGDEFHIKIYNTVLSYQVDQIEVVVPTDTKALVPEAGKDYVTLVTCTPYAVNSHRLLVRGVRVHRGDGLHVVEEPYRAEGVAGEADLFLLVIVGIIALLFALILIFIVATIVKRRRERKERARKNRRRQRARGHRGRYYEGA